MLNEENISGKSSRRPDLLSNLSDVCKKHCKLFRHIYYAEATMFCLKVMFYESQSDHKNKTQLTGILFHGKLTNTLSTVSYIKY